LRQSGFPIAICVAIEIYELLGFQLPWPCPFVNCPDQVE
jgi:hypothetical protein